MWQLGFGATVGAMVLANPVHAAPVHAATSQTMQIGGFAILALLLASSFATARAMRLRRRELRVKR